MKTNKPIAKCAGRRHLYVYSADPAASEAFSHTHRCQHGLRKMRESARNDISRTHANVARAHKMRAKYHISMHIL